MLTADTHTAASPVTAEAPGTAAATTTRWTEWIEPVSITARHPFGFSTCKVRLGLGLGLGLGVRFRICHLQG